MDYLEIFGAFMCGIMAAACGMTGHGWAIAAISGGLLFILAFMDEAKKTKGIK